MPLPFLSTGTPSSLWPVTNLAGTSNILSQGGVPATAIRQRDNAVIYDRAGSTIQVRS